MKYDRIKPYWPTSRFILSISSFALKLSLLMISFIWFKKNIFNCHEMNQNLFDRLVSLHFKFCFGFKLVWDWEYIPAKRRTMYVVQGQFISWFFFLLWKWMSCERIWHPRGQINRSFFERFWNLLYFFKMVQFCYSNYIGVQ